MRTRTAYTLLSAAAAALAQDTAARPVVDNAPGARYVARLEGGAISGAALAGSDAFGRGVTFHVELSGLPEGAGPFNFHLHEAPVPEDGDCMGTGGHLDPYGRTASPPCDASAPETCEVGDLSGKYGRLDGESDEISFHDLYTSLTPGREAYFGDKSFVVHAADGSRIACASFEVVAEEEDHVPEEEGSVEGEDEECDEDDEDDEDEEEDEDEEDGEEGDCAEEIEEEDPVTEEPEDAEVEDEEGEDGEEGDCAEEIEEEDPVTEEPEDDEVEDEDCVEEEETDEETDGDTEEDIEECDE